MEREVINHAWRPTNCDNCDAPLGDHEGHVLEGQRDRLYCLDCVEEFWIRNPDLRETCHRVVTLKDLVEIVAGIGLPRSDVRATLLTALDVLTLALESGRDVHLRGYGKLSIEEGKLVFKPSRRVRQSLSSRLSRLDGL